MKPLWRKILYIAAGVAVVATIASAVTINVLRAKDGVVEVPLEEYEALRQTAVFNDLLEAISERYYGEVPSREELFQAALKGMLGALGDPYAQYFTEEEYEKYLQQFNGEHVGLGLLVSQVDAEGSIVLDVYDNTPAAAAGVQSGDIIVGVDGEPVAGLPLDDLIKRLSGREGQTVVLTLKRGADIADYPVVLQKLAIKHVHSSLFKQYTGYIRIDMFSGNCAEEFAEAMRNLMGRKMKSLVVDLRNNPGGSLEAVVAVADALIGAPDQIIVTVKDAGGTEEIYRTSGDGQSLPLAILVNANSASASELLAAAVQENGAGLVVGTTTYGKGVVQSTVRLQSNSAWVKLTTAAYYTPKGNSLQGKGVVPDIEVELSDDYIGVPIDRIGQEDDAQLWAALDYVREEAQLRAAG